MSCHLCPSLQSAKEVCRGHWAGRRWKEGGGVNDLLLMLQSRSKVRMQVKEMGSKSVKSDVVEKGCLASMTSPWVR